MRLAIIDLGTNSVRFDVYQIDHSLKSRVLHREKSMVRLGQGVFLSGKLDDNAYRRTLHIFSHYKKVADELHVKKIVAIATSALREATDSARLIKAVREKTGIDLRIISGTEEAKLIAQGVLAHEKISTKTTALIDIGGGSTEISICKNRKAVVSESFPLGTARLQQVFLKSSPPREESVEELRRYIRNVIYKKIYEQKWPKAQQAFGSSGTVKALNKMLKKEVHSKGLPLKKISQLIKTMLEMNTTQLLGIPGMEAKRVDMILAGTILLEELMQAIGSEHVISTDYSLRDGVLREQLQILKQHKGPILDLRLDDWVQKAKKFGLTESQSRHWGSQAEILFEKTLRLHKLKPQYVAYLKAAVILRNTGEAISVIGHEEHSHYIVKNANFPSMETWESDLIANLCRFHNRCKTAPDTINSIEFKGDKKIKDTFNKLLGLLCVLDSMEHEISPETKIARIQIKPKGVYIHFHGVKHAESHTGTTHEPKKCLFSLVFKRPFYYL